MSVCRVLTGTGHCGGLITRQEGSYRASMCLTVYDQLQQKPSTATVSGQTEVRIRKKKKEKMTWICCQLNEQHLQLQAASINDS